MSPGPDTAASTLSLAAVMPVFNEAAALEASLRNLRTELDAAGQQQAPIVVVDDGSSDGSGRLADALAGELGLQVVHQANAGRFGARLAGLRATSADQVLLVDCGLGLAPGAVAFLAEQLRTHPDRRVWNGDVDVVTDGNPLAAFWKVIPAVVWRAYTANRRLTSFGIGDFDRYPKGTGLFSAPRQWLLDAAEPQARAGDTRFGSDDTALIRDLLGPARQVWLAPEFGCRYYPRTNLAAFARHAYGRGTTFVAGYLHADGPIGRCLRAAPIAVTAPAAATALAGWCAPGLTTAVLGLAACCLLGAAATAAARCGCRPAESVGAAVVAPLFAATFGAGVVRGLLRSRRSR